MKILLTAWYMSFQMLFSGETLAAVGTVYHLDGICPCAELKGSRPTIFEGDLQ